MNPDSAARSGRSTRGGPRRSPVAIERARDRTVDLLCKHFARDAFGLDEFERRVDRAHSARTAADLDALLTDLPTLPAGPPDQDDETGAAVEPSGAESEAVQRRAPGRHPTRARRTGYVFACLGGAERTGRWTPPRHLVGGALFGGLALDFRDAVLPPGETRLTVACMAGGVEIIVPPDLPVDANGIAILGGFDHAERTERPTDPDSPILRISGTVVMGGVSIEVRLLGESARDAKRRRKAERKRIRALQTR